MEPPGAAARQESAHAAPLQSREIPANSITRRSSLPPCGRDAAAKQSGEMPTKLGTALLETIVQIQSVEDKKASERHALAATRKARREELRKQALQVLTPQDGARVLPEEEVRG